MGDEELVEAGGDVLTGGGVVVGVSGVVTVPICGSWPSVPTQTAGLFCRPGASVVSGSDAEGRGCVTGGVSSGGSGCSGMLEDGVDIISTD